MVIRRASDGDVDTLVELNADVQEIHRRIRPDLFKQSRTPEIADAFRSMLTSEDHSVFICEVEGEAIGYFVLCIVRRQEHAFKYAETFMELDQVCIRSAHRRSGIGRAIMEKARELAHSQGIRRLDLSVWTENENAVESFGRMGFGEYCKRMTMRLEE
jgi:ribosomal protein S18 acetylase RimI-like enzyme